MATLRVERDRGWADLLRSYRIVVDGTTAGTVRNGESREFDIRPGRHRIAARIDWCGSATREFEVSDGGVASFVVRSNLRGLRMLLALWYVIADRNAYLCLDRSA